MTKARLRSAYKEKRMQVSGPERMKWDDLMLIRFQQLELPSLHEVMSFYPLEQFNEVNTFLFTDFLHFRNLNLHISYPRTNPSAHTMEAVACGADTIFEASSMNIPEPVGSDIVSPDLLDLVIIPLLAFDKQGYRVGYGKGYYDRFLLNCRPDCIRLGLSYFEPVNAIEDISELDVPLDLCVTPQELYIF
jgi:5-formyltetrahydrofolate cyclo-ligase